MFVLLRLEAGVNVVIVFNEESNIELMGRGINYGL
jgi:hypothetical protein